MAQIKCLSVQMTEIGQKIFIGKKYNLVRSQVELHDAYLLLQLECTGSVLVKTAQDLKIFACLPIFEIIDCQQSQEADNGAHFTTFFVISFSQSIQRNEKVRIMISCC